MPSRTLKLAVLVSGGGTTLQNLLDRAADRSLPAAVTIVIGSRPNSGAQARAAAAGVRYEVVDRKGFVDAEGFSQRVFELIDAAGADLICLAGFLSMLVIPEKWQGRILNIHPSLLPSFGGKGMYGEKVHAAVLAHGCKVSGCTVHLVDEHYDNGPILVQRVCDVLEGDTPEGLARRVFEQEKLAYAEAIRLFAEDRVTIDGRRVRIK